VAEAVTISAPAVEFAVKAEEVATPLVLVVTVSVAVEFDANVPLAPDAGAVKVTVTPAVGFPPVVTVATSGLVNVVATAVLCPDPLVDAIATTGGGCVEELEPQPVKNPNARKPSARMLQQALRFIGNSVSGPLSD
jgi:hypothetical protein